MVKKIKIIPRRGHGDKEKKTLFESEKKTIMARGVKKYEVKKLIIERKKDNLKVKKN